MEALKLWLSPRLARKVNFGCGWGLGLLGKLTIHAMLVWRARLEGGVVHPVLPVVGKSMPGSGTLLGILVHVVGSLVPWGLVGLGLPGWEGRIRSFPPVIDHRRCLPRRIIRRMALETDLCAYVFAWRFVRRIAPMVDHRWGLSDWRRISVLTGSGSAVPESFGSLRVAAGVADWGGILLSLGVLVGNSRGVVRARVCRSAIMLFRRQLGDTVKLVDSFRKSELGGGKRTDLGFFRGHGEGVVYRIHVSGASPLYVCSDPFQRRALKLLHRDGVFATPLRACNVHKITDQQVIRLRLRDAVTLSVRLGSRPSSHRAVSDHCQCGRGGHCARPWGLPPVLLGALLHHDLGSDLRRGGHLVRPRSGSLGSHCTRCVGVALVVEGWSCARGREH